MTIEFGAQMSIDDWLSELSQSYKIKKPIRLIELFGGIGAQAAAIKRLNCEYELYKYSEWDVNAVAQYKAIHIKDDTNYSVNLSFNELCLWLDSRGVSLDGKSPLPLDKIVKKGEKWVRTTYNNYIATHNIGSVVTANGEDLGICDTDKYEYILCYSFPCQDLSVAGKQIGMSEGSESRSSLLWHVARLLRECEEKPQILLMENVTQVHGKKFINDWNKWLQTLEDLGYKNFWQDLNAKDYGVAQNRNRTFMISILNKNANYKFPDPFELSKCMKDYLEDEVEEKYYINNDKAKMLIQQLIDRRELP